MPCPLRAQPHIWLLRTLLVILRKKKDRAQAVGIAAFLSEQRSGPSKHTREPGSSSRRLSVRSTAPPMWKTVPASDTVDCTSIRRFPPGSLSTPGTNSSPIEDTRRRSPGVLLFLPQKMPILQVFFRDLCCPGLLWGIIWSRSNVQVSRARRVSIAWTISSSISGIQWA